MTATDELRRLLDERGVEWRGGLPTETMVDEPLDLLYVERPDGTLCVFVRSYLTPEQAVEATLGSGENAELRELVRNVEHYEQYGCYECPHSGSCGAGTLYDEGCAMSREIEREKRELGIEVDA